MRLLKIFPIAMLLSIGLICQKPLLAEEDSKSLKKAISKYYDPRTCVPNVGKHHEALLRREIERKSIMMFNCLTVNEIPSVNTATSFTKEK